MKKKMRTWLAVILLVFIGCGHIGGCVVGQDEEGNKTVNIDPNKAEDIQKGAETALGIMTLLSPFFPVLIPIVTGGAAVLATWKKMKPKLTMAQSERAMYHSIASCSVIAIDSFRETYPKEWENLLERLEVAKNKAIKPEDRMKIENLIRGLRGLPPKE